ncbi:MAG: response regulator [Chloroflexi bacterium]|nr:MAG: response regulator [Chloroflexota bacterium]
MGHPQNGRRGPISTILLIEDNKQNALLMRRLLEKNGHRVVHADEGQSGLGMAAAEPPDLILIDLGLPDIDGETIIGILKRIPALAETPIVAVTAWPQETAREMAQAYGCDGLILKPINTRSFTAEVEKYLRR